MDILEEIEHLEQEAAAFGLQWETKDQIMTQIRNECLEIEEHFHSPEQKEALQEELGDLLHAVFSLCVFCNFSPELTVRQSLDKFANRLNAMKEIAKEQGLTDLKGKSFDELMHYWEKQKQEPARNPSTPNELILLIFKNKPINYLPTKAYRERWAFSNKFSKKEFLCLIKCRALYIKC